MEGQKDWLRGATMADDLVDQMDSPRETQMAACLEKQKAEPRACPRGEMKKLDLESQKAVRRACPRGKL
jgi:hypothetical protein